MTHSHNEAMAKFKLTPEGVIEAAKFKKIGVPDNKIAAYLGVCPQTFSVWINHPKTKLQRELSEALKKAEAERQAALLSKIYKAADNPKTWQAAAWLLERLSPEEYGRVDRAPKEERTAEVPTFIFEPESVDE